MRRYPEYEDSGVEWIGKIPKHWQVFKFRYLSQESRRKNDDDANREMLSLSSYTGVQLKHYEYESTKRTKDESLTYLVVEPNQLVVNPMWQMKRSIGVSYLHGIVSPGYRVYYVDLERLVPQYLHHLMRSDNYVDEYNKHVRGITTYDRSVKKEDFEEIAVLIPPRQEQTQIANFLDRKTQQIDELIRVKERKIELLGEYRASLINQAVTKGLDPNVEMRPSGVEWIGEIPKAWNTVPLTKYLESIIDYRGRTPEKTESGRFLVTAKNVKNGQLDYQISREFTSEPEYQKIMTRGIPQMGDVLFTTEAPLGQVANVDDPSIALAQRIIKLRPKSDLLNPYFLKYWLLSPSFQSDLQRYATGSTVLGIKASKLCLLKLNLPPLKNQAQIANFLDHKTKQIDELRSSEEQTIKLLKEYRQSLISAVVTGKIDVRGEV